VNQDERDSFERPEREVYDRQVAAVLDEHQVELICLAGYMRLLSPLFVAKFLNPHPEYSPFAAPVIPRAGIAAPGARIRREIRGCTVHFVDENLDAGPIILQATVPVLDGRPETTLSEKILKEEHRIYSQAVNIVLEGKYKIEGRRVLRTS